MRTLRFKLVRVTNLTDEEFAKLQEHPYSNYADEFKWEVNTDYCILIKKHVRDFKLKLKKNSKDNCIFKEEVCGEFEETENGLIGNRILQSMEEEYGVESQIGLPYYMDKYYPIPKGVKELFSMFGYKKLDETDDSVVCIVFDYCEDYDTVEQD